MGRLLVLSGPSAGGKSTLQRALGARGCAQLVTVTTRPPRRGELNGRDYHFLPLHDFEKAYAKGAILERTTYAETVYGIFRSDLEAVKAAPHGSVTVAVLDATGVEFVRDYLGAERVKAVYVSVNVESMARRLAARGSSDKEVQSRLAHAALERDPDYLRVFDAIVSNDDVSGSEEEAIGALLEALCSLFTRSTLDVAA